MRIPHPAVTARVAARQSSFTASSSPTIPSATGKSAGSVTARKLGSVTLRNAGDRSLGQYWLRDADLLRVLGGLLQQIALRPEVHGQRHHELLANRVDRGIGHLGEQLAEIRREELWPRGEHRQRRVVPHGAGRFLARVGHRRQNHLELVGGVAERALSNRER